MLNKKSRLSLHKVAFASLFSLCAWGLPLKAIADDLQVPNNIGLPGRREGGASRDGCYQSKRTLQALAPADHWGKTLAATPTFFVFVPPHQAEEAEFILEEVVNGKASQQVYKTQIPLNQDFGITGINPLQNPGAPKLEPGKVYQWTFQLFCQDNPGGFVSGIIERVEPGSTLVTELQQATPAKQVEIYARENLWYDRLQTLAKLRLQNNDAQVDANWRSVLNTVGLADIAAEPIVACCATASAVPTSMANP